MDHNCQGILIQLAKQDVNDVGEMISYKKNSCLTHRHADISWIFVGLSESHRKIEHLERCQIISNTDLQSTTFCKGVCTPIPVTSGFPYVLKHEVPAVASI